METKDCAARRRVGLVVLPSLLASSMAVANTGQFVPDRISVEKGHVYISNPGYKNTKSCDIEGMVKLNKDSLGFQEMYSMALTATTAKKEIGFWISSCESSPWGKSIGTAYMSYMGG